MAEPVVGVLLAGGQARRMGGGDKCLLPLADETILARILRRIAPQVAALVLNANGDPARFAAFGLPVAPDAVPGFPGPLAGVLAGLDWARANAPDCPWVVTAPCDAPFMPGDLVARLLAAAEAEGADLACAASGGRDHPVCGLWPVRLAEDLRAALVEEGVRKVDAWTGRYRLARAVFADHPVDPFLNVNRPEDLAEAEALIAAGAGGPG